MDANKTMQDSYYFRTLQECDTENMLKIFEDVYPESEPLAACLASQPEEMRESKSLSVKVYSLNVRRI